MTDEQTTPRRVIVVDTETTGLDFDHDTPLEVGWQDYATGEHGVFVPEHDVDHILGLSIAAKALEINGYRERIMHRPQDDGTEVQRLYDALTGATLVGSAPAIDCAMLVHLFHDYDIGTNPRPWHHRVVDLASYAAGRLGLPLGEVEGLWRLSELLGVERPDHGALSDVRSTIACLRALEALPHATVEHAALTDGTVIREMTYGQFRDAGWRE